MIEASLEDAYAEACRALGESIVRERILSRIIEAQSQPDPS